MLLLLNRWGHWGTERLRNLSTVCSEAIFGHSYSLSRCLLKHGFYVSFPSLEIWIHTSWRADLPPTRPSGSPPAWPRLFPHLMPHSPLVWTLPLVTSSSHLPPLQSHLQVPSHLGPPGSPRFSPSHCPPPARPSPSSCLLRKQAQGEGRRWELCDWLGACPGSVINSTWELPNVIDPLWASISWIN